MKNWLDKMERRFGRYAIRNLTMYLLAGYAIGYLLSFTMPQLLTYFTLEPALILKGQVWRLLSWVIIPPNDNIIFVIFMMLLYWKATGGHFVTMFTFFQEYYLQLLELLL